MWVATVENIDWPSKPGLPVDKQKQEFIAILDKCVELNINAVIFQIRTQADALYDSKLEPWSEFLTGKMGSRRSRTTIRSSLRSRRRIGAGCSCMPGSIRIACPRVHVEE